MPLLEISNLTVEFPAAGGGRVVAADDVSLRVGRGEIVGVAGESGAGKSTVGAAVLDLIEPPGRITAGEIRLNNEALPLGRAFAMRAFRGRRIGAIFQDPLTSLDPLFSIAAQLSETLRYHYSNLSAAKARMRGIELLQTAGIAAAEARIGDYPHQFSGGMRQRAVIALALAPAPELLIADEPTTALDVSAQARILKLLRAEAKRRNIGVLLITHDFGVINEVADKVAVMKDGAVMEFGPTADVLARPRRAYTKSLIAAVPPADRKLRRFLTMENPAAGGRPPSADDRRRARLLQNWPSAPAIDGMPAVTGALLEVVGLSKTFGGGFFNRGAEIKAVDDVNFAVAAGESLGLVGESGSGKTTIARMIAGLDAADSGRVLFAGRDLSIPKERAAARRKVQMIFQDPYSSLNPRLRAGFAIAEPLLTHEPQTPRVDIKERVADLLALVGLPADAANKWPHQFSGGQRQRIAIARALATAPQLLICDEPTSALDVSIQAQILNLMKDLQERLGLSLLFISHDFPVVRQMCERIGVLRAGRLLELRPTADLFAAPQTDYAAELLSLIPRL